VSRRNTFPCAGIASDPSHDLLTGPPVPFFYRLLCPPRRMLRGRTHCMLSYNWTTDRLFAHPTKVGSPSPRPRSFAGGPSVAAKQAEGLRVFFPSYTSRRPDLRDRFGTAVCLFQGSAGDLLTRRPLFADRTGQVPFFQHYQGGSVAVLPRRMGHYRNQVTSTETCGRTTRLE